MPIEVEIPGVGIAEFPDGTPPETIERILQQQNPAQKQGLMGRLFNPQREDFPEYPAGGTPEQALETERRLGDQNATLSQDRYGNPTLVSERGTFYPNRPGFSLGDIPRALSGAKDVAKDVAPFLAGGAVTAPAKVGQAVASQAGIGLASESINQAGNAALGDDVQWSKLVTTPVFSGLGEWGGRAAFHVLRPVFNKLLGSRAPSNLINQDGTLSDDAIKALESTGVSPAQFDDLTQAELSRATRSGQLGPEEAERFNFFTRQGLQPTKAQVSRTADDFQLQQEAVKRSTAVREALEKQEGQIAEAFDTRIRGTGGSGTSSGSPVADAVLDKATRLDEEISGLYNAARESAPETKFVRPERLVETLRQYAPENQLSGGVIRAIRGDLQSRGVIAQGSGFKPGGRVDVNTAEEIRKTLNSIRRSLNPGTQGRGITIIDDLKNALDDDVMAAAGKDFFEQARAAKASFEAGLRPQKLSKFDANQRSLVRDVLQNKVKPDDLFDRAVLGKSWKASDLRELKGYLTKGSPEQVKAGTKAWDDLRAETLDYIKNFSFIGPEDASGIKALSRDKIEKVLGRIGEQRLGVLFSQQERQFLDDMVRLAKWREPVRHTERGKGPSAQAIEGLTNRMLGALEKIPLGLGEMNAALRAYIQEVQALANPAAKVMNRAKSAAVKGAVSTPGASAGVALEDRLTGER